VKHILAPRQRSLLEALTRRDLVLAFDFDGTLAPIVAEPSRARMRRRTRELLRVLARRYRCAVISGRAVRDLRPRLHGIRIARLIGNHGAEPGSASRRAGRSLRRVRAWRRVLAQRLRSIHGVVLEDKGLSLTAHFRNSPRRRAAAAAVRRAVRDLEGARMVRGKAGISIVPSGAPNKGEALSSLLRELGCEAAVYVGDDVTDEDVFSSRLPHSLLTVRIGPSRVSRAKYYLQNQTEIEDFLAALLELSQPAEGKKVRAP
jgi:trehalose 6-phosphate phosphatase